MSQDQDIDQDGPGGAELDDGIGVDPLGDADDLSQNQAKKNFAKVGSARPTTLLYTYGPGAIIDLPHFTVMPTGLDDWERIWRRRAADPITVHAPRLLETVQLMLGHQVSELRRFPWQPSRPGARRDGDDLGVPARVLDALHRLRPPGAAQPIRQWLPQYPSLPARPGRLRAHRLPRAPRPSGRGPGAQGRQGRSQAQGQTALTVRARPLPHCLPKWPPR